MRAAIFDMDGVLVDSEVHWRAVEWDFLCEIAPGWGEADHRSIIGMSIYDLYDVLRERCGTTIPRERYVARYLALAGQVYGERVALLTGARELLEDLSSGWRLGLASSSPRAWIEIVLRRFDLASYFAVVASGDDVPHGKPDPSIYRLAAERLPLLPEACVAIEDSAKGVRSAKGAGMRCVGLRNGANDDQDLSPADAVVASLTELSPARLSALWDR